MITFRKTYNIFSETKKIEYIIFIAFVLPVFPKILIPVTGTSYFGDYIIFASIMFFILFDSVNLKLRISGLRVAILCIFSIIIIISILKEITYVSIKDLFEILRPLYCFIIFSYFYSYSRRNDLKEVFSFITYIFIFLVLFGIIESMTDFGNQIATFLYKRSTNILKNKAVGPFSLTYSFGYFLIFVTWVFLIKSFNEIKVKNIILSFLSIVCLLLTQSRTMFIAMAVSLIFAIFIFFHVDRKIFKRYIIFFTVLIIILTIILFNYWDFMIYYFSYLYDGIARLILNGVEIGGSGSINIRLNQFVWAIQNQSFIPLIGAGIGKNTGPLLESFYALYYYRYGLIGIFFAIVILFYGFINTIKAYKICDSKFRNFFLAFSIFLTIQPIAWVSSALQDHPRLAILYYGVIGITVGYVKKDRGDYEKYNKCLNNNTTL